VSGLPNGWTTACLGDLGIWSSGGTPSRKNADYFGGDIPWVKTGDLKDSLVDEIDGTITERGLKNSSAKLLPAGTLLVAMYGATIGRTGVLKNPAATNQACAAFIPDVHNAELVPYLWWFLRASIDQLRALGQGGAQPNISQTLLKRFPVPVPPLPEQRRIVARLDSRVVPSQISPNTVFSKVR
jgi:type I restriction enzyme S subunit